MGKRAMVPLNPNEDLSLKISMIHKLNLHEELIPPFVLLFIKGTSLPESYVRKIFNTGTIKYLYELLTKTNHRL